MTSDQPKKKYRFLTLCDQPLRLYFGFMPKYAHRSSVGFVIFQIKIGRPERLYGYYLTDLRSTSATWNNRHYLQPSKVAQELQKEVLDLNERLEVAWDSFPQRGEPITGEMILHQAGLNYPVVQLKWKGGFFYAV
ncbi:hypothetical protein GO755_00155 [Spirosoma sp. HMF4905]|uniref:Uncharacterized protein n=1 Tax=Spirosoma arboris TaxID=2682092 RepID=A0A7K1S3M2_9BACT|nr:hypothetical protein [Spirosoma arboris]MVM28423.1 hypothetical protein [Spirosoma arboris]